MKKKTQYIDDERAIGNGIFVTLHYGWKFSEDMLVPTHVRSYDTPKEAHASIKNAVPCSCIECKKRVKK